MKFLCLRHQGAFGFHPKKLRPVPSKARQRDQVTFVDVAIEHKTGGPLVAQQRSMLLCFFFARDW
jgi:hypothetical protein